MGIINLIMLIITLVMLFLAFIYIVSWIDDGKSTVHPFFIFWIFFGFINLYFCIKYIFGLFATLIYYWPIISLMIAKIILFILHDPLALTITGLAILTLLGFIEKETSVIYVILNNIHDRNDHRLSVQLRRRNYSTFRDRIKSEIVGSFESEAKKVIK